MSLNPQIPIQFQEGTGDGPWQAIFPNRSLSTVLFGAWTFEERWTRLLARRGRSNGNGNGFQLFVSSLSIATPELCDAIAAASRETAWLDDTGRTIAALRKQTGCGEIGGDVPLDKIARDLPTAGSVGGALLEKPWELIAGNGAQIEADTEAIHGGHASGAPAVIEGISLGGAVEVEGDNPLRAGADLRLEPFVYFDTREGPIEIGRRVTIEAHTVIRGPVCIRDDAVIRGGAKIVEGTTIGEASRVGGEVECTIFGAFSNKQHDGFLGHAVVGEWVNLGASTNNSDLKNNYGAVRLDFGEGPIETGSTKIGCFLADHVKSAIGTRISTGTVVGPCANLFGEHGLVKGYIPPYTWGETGDLYDFERSVETMKRVRSRRAAPLEEAGRPAQVPQVELEALRELWEAAKRSQGGRT